MRRRIQDAFEGKPRKVAKPQQQAESRAEPAPASDEAHSEPQDEPRTGRKEVLRARRQCFKCKRKLPEGMCGPKQWNGECKGGWAKRVCLKCRPDSAPHGYRFCTRCEKLLPVDAFSKHFLKSNNVGGMFQRVCKSCPARTDKQHAASKLLARSRFFRQGALFRRNANLRARNSSARGEGPG